MVSIFEKLTYKQVRTLIEVLNATVDKDYEFIKKKFHSGAENFIEALEFLKGLKLLTIKNGEIIKSNELSELINDSDFDDNQIKSFLLEKTINSTNDFSSEIEEYLSNFKVTFNNFEYKPTTVNRLKDSGIRNLFIELDLIQYDKDNFYYRITDKYFFVFSNYINKNKLSPLELKCLLKKRNELGIEAELLIKEYEEKRLSEYPDLIKCIQHISLNDVNAGYDILSWEINTKKNENIPRYIEVKAVSKSNFKFFLSRNEIQKARLYHEKYYIYLLPVISKNNFDVSFMKVIRNPYKKLFSYNSNWYKQEEQYSFWKKVKNEY